jgi:outer membrane protein OmpA-like peptidoglycan-associated protein
MGYKSMFFRAFLIAMAANFTMAVAARAQGGGPNVPFDKAHIPDAAQLKMALAAIKKGDALAPKGGLDQDAATSAYAQAMQVNPDNADLNLKMGVCLLNGGQPPKALRYLQHALELDPYLPRIHYLVGYALQLNAKWDEAIAEYKRHGEVVRMNPDPDRTFNMVDKRITECNYGKAFMATPARAEVANLGPSVNSRSSEYGAVLDGKGTMYFTSRRPETTGGKVNKVTNTWFEDIYSTQWEPSGWSVPEPLAEPMNSARNDATVAISADGQNMIIYRDETNGGDLFSSRKMADGWSAPQALPATVNSVGQESSAWCSADGQWLYFVSSREGGLGGSDIYKSHWDAAANTWGTAENLGPDINTIYDEEGVYLTPDGNTLYFASQGHTSMGGYDLFKSTQANGLWSKPENLGWPINSPGDDQFLVLTADGSTGYFNSVRAGGMGEDDIYRVQFTPPVQADETAMLASAGNSVPTKTTAEQTRLEGFIKGLKMMQPVDAVVEVMSVRDPSFEASFRTVSGTGEYTAVVPAGKDYAVHVTADGFLLHSERLEKEVGKVHMDMNLQPMVPGSTEVMRNILFNKNSQQLDSGSTIELEKLVAFLDKNPALRIEIGGHTDNDIGPIPNQPLSEARAYVVLNWLVAHGISPDRLEAKGYGDSQPIAPNTDEEGKARNRRTEIRVL